MDSNLMIKKEDRGTPDRDRGRDRERSRRGDRPSRFSSNTRDRSPVRDRRRPGDRRVYVSNVAYESKWQDIKDLFRAEVGEVTYVELFVDENDKPRGCGIVEFESPELAARAVEKMHRFDLKGRKLVVKDVGESDVDKFGRPAPNRNRGASDRDVSSSGNSRRDDHPRSSTWEGNNQLPSISSNTSTVGASGGNSNASKFGNTYGLSPTFLESLWINGPLVSKVFVANLDYKVDEKKLREVFKLAGKVVHAEISMDKEGKSRGFGVVEYDHPVEAVQSISMLHNQTLFDRRLTVRMDRVDKPDGPPKLPEGLKGIGMGLGTNGAVLNDVARNLPNMTNSPPLSSLASNVQQLQQAAAAAAAAQAQVQLAQGAQLGAPSLNAVNQGPLAHLAGSNTLAPNLTNVSSLLGTLNVPDLASLNANQQFGGAALNSSQALNAGLGAGLAGLNASLATGLGVGGSGIGANFNSSTFNNSVGSQRDFDSMSAALSGPNQGGYGYGDRDRDRDRGDNNFRGSYNGNGRGQGNIIPGGNSRRTDTIIVKNLPPNVSWNHLLEKFRDVGEIQGIDVQGKDSGLIKFSSEWEAERAVREFDRTRFEGRTIDVLFYNI